MPHLVLIGNSIFDNAAYTRGGPDVVSQVRGLLAPGWEATLLAVDGSTADQVAGQLGRLPKAATHLVLSVGGNDALMHQRILEAPASSMASPSRHWRTSRPISRDAIVWRSPPAWTPLYRWPCAPFTTGRSTISLSNASPPQHSRCSTTRSYEWPSSTLSVITCAQCVSALRTMPIRSNRRRWAGQKSHE